MTRNPLVNALAATFYIVLIASVMFYGTKFTGPANSIIAPVAVVSLFTLKHNPDKTDPEYFKKMLEHFNLYLL